MDELDKMVVPETRASTRKIGYPDIDVSTALTRVSIRLDKYICWRVSVWVFGNYDVRVCVYCMESLVETARAYYPDCTGTLVFPLRTIHRWLYPIALN